MEHEHVHAYTHVHVCHLHIPSYCRLHRQPKHLLAFLLAELGTNGSIDGNNQLIIKGRFQQKQIETVLRRYISECQIHVHVHVNKNSVYFACSYCV